MKKFILFLGVLAILGFSAVTVNATVNAVTPSTNDINRTNGWAHVNQLSQDVGETELEFVNSRNFFSCFEYRTDGDTSQVVATNGGVNYNPDIIDGLYPYLCLNNDTTSMVIEAMEYVEVRMVFGAEGDERFDWTRFDVLYPRMAEITSPEVNEEVSGMVDFEAYLNDDDKDSIQWAVRKDSCSGDTVFGNVDGFNNVATIDMTDLSNQTFSYTGDMSMMTPGEYCFVYNPREDSGESNIRETRMFILADTIAPKVTIETPSDGDIVSGVVSIYGTIEEDYAMGNYNIAIYAGDADFMDFSARLEQENVNPASIFNNKLIYEWDTTAYEDGEYLIRFAARDAAGNRDLSLDPSLGGDDSQHVITVIVNNILDFPLTMDECKKDGWKIFDGTTFKNQGDCVSYVQSNGNSSRNN